MRLVGCETQEDKIGIQAVDAVGGIRVILRIRTLRSDEVHDLVLTFTWDRGVTNDNLKVLPAGVCG